jgi:hypothetical protein
MAHSHGERLTAALEAFQAAVREAASDGWLDEHSCFAFFTADGSSREISGGRVLCRFSMEPVAAEVQPIGDEHGASA